MVECIRSSQRKDEYKVPIKRRIPKDIVKELNEHEYVGKATEWTIQFTPEFKRHAYNAYHSGKSMREVFQDAGFDIEIIGVKRIENFRQSLIKKANDENGFEDERRNNSRKEAKTTESQMAKRIRELEHRNAYLEQENEFLKKIQQLEKGCGGQVGGTK